MVDVFITYKRDERSAIEQIARALRGVGLTVWFDASLSAGESFSDEIDREAHAAAAVLVCWSPAARKSRWVKAEAMIGFEHDKLAACYVAGPDGFSAPAPFNAIHCADLRAWYDCPGHCDPGWKSVLRGIGRLCARPDLESWGALDVRPTEIELGAWMAAHNGSPLLDAAEELLDAQRAARRVDRPTQPFPDTHSGAESVVQPSDADRELLEDQGATRKVDGTAEPLPEARGDREATVRSSGLAPEEATRDAPYPQEAPGQATRALVWRSLQDRVLSLWRKVAAAAETWSQRHSQADLAWWMVVFTASFMLFAIGVWAVSTTRVTETQTELRSRAAVDAVECTVSDQYPFPLEFYDLIVERVDSALRVHGTVCNISSELTNVPPIRIALRDASGVETQHSFHRVAAQQLGAGETMVFEVRIDNPAANATDLEVTFQGDVAASEPAGQVVERSLTPLEQAARSGDLTAQYELGVQLLDSGGTQEGVSLLRSAAERGFAMAQYRLAKLYERGHGVRADLVQARQWTERAAAAGNSRAMHDLGVYWARGEGGSRDDEAAARWFLQAAELGVEDSQYNLGVVYQQGRGVNADSAKALFWFVVAAEHGDRDAVTRSAALEAQMTPEQVERVHADARGFSPRDADAVANGSFGARAWMRDAR